MNVPITTSALVDSACRRVLDLTGEGLPEIPILGMNRSVRTTEGSIFHRHASMEITYCVSGSVKFDCGGRAYPIMPGGVFVSLPKDVHRLRVNPKGAKLYWIFLRLPGAGGRMLGLDRSETSWLVKSLKALPRKSFQVPQEVGLCFERLFSALETEKSCRSARRLKLRVAAIRLLIALVEAGTSSSDCVADLRFRTLVDRMRRMPKKTFSMSEAVRELRCSPNTVRSLFKRFVGVPPQAFMMKCRIRKAEDLLRKGHSVTDVAEELGFSSSQNFSVSFRQETGQSPTDWRRAHV